MNDGVRYEIEREGDGITIPGRYYDELVDFASMLNRQMAVDKGGLVPDGHGLTGLEYVQNFENILRANDTSILTHGYKLKDYYGYHFSRYSVFYNVSLPDFFPEYRKLGRNSDSTQIAFDAKFKKCVHVVKIIEPEPSTRKIVEKPAFIEAQNEAQKEEIKAIVKWMSKQRDAKLRDIAFTLTVNDIKALLMSSHCHYTGIPLRLYDEVGPDLPDDQLTLDRIDNEIGYEPGNVVACAHIVNKIKSNGDTESIKKRLLHLQEEIIKAEKNEELLASKKASYKKQESILNTVISTLEGNGLEEAITEDSIDFEKLMKQQNVTPYE